MKVNLPLHYQLRVYFSKTAKRDGICSNVHNDPQRHVLLWDFDNSTSEAIGRNLEIIQRKFKLSDIYLVSSSQYSYHAYCFTAVPLVEAIHILSGTKGTDLAYLRLGMVRGYYTLRISPRQHESFRLVRVIRSDYPPNVAPDAITVNEYWTTNIKTGVYKNAKG